MTFPDGEKPDANVTIDVAGYDKIVEALQEAAKTDPEASQYFHRGAGHQGICQDAAGRPYRMGDQRQGTTAR